MALKQILSVSGKPGLYRLVGQMKNGIIVESIADGRRFPVYGSTKVSALEEISIYTSGEELPLNEVMKRLYERHSGKPVELAKDDKPAAKKEFEETVPEYDPERVYVSDMLKVLKWYNLLVAFDAYDPNETEEEAEDTPDATAVNQKGEEAKTAGAESGEHAQPDKKDSKKTTKAATKKPAKKSAADTDKADKKTPGKGKEKSSSATKSPGKKTTPKKK
ncbi:MAG: hypothetical protein Kow0075_08980 [Salibacteraceae bacterium]